MLRDRAQCSLQIKTTTGNTLNGQTQTGVYVPVDIVKLLRNWRVGMPVSQTR